MHRTHYLIWRRGFAPVLFILAIALIFVAVGSGVYFATKKSAPNSVVEQPVSSQQSEPAATSTATTSIVALSTTTKNVLVKNVSGTPAVASVDCGSSDKTAKCLAGRAQACLPARGIMIDPSSGLKVERIIDGFKGDKCSYRSNILSGAGSLAILAGMNIDCMIPKAKLSTTIGGGGSISREEMLALCTGTFIDLIRAQTGSTK